MEHIDFCLEELADVLSKGETWEASGPDFIQYYWFKKCMCVHTYLFGALSCLIKDDTDIL